MTGYVVQPRLSRNIAALAPWVATGPAPPAYFVTWSVGFNHNKNLHSNPAPGANQHPAAVRNAVIEQVLDTNSYRSFNCLIACPQAGEALAIGPLDRSCSGTSKVQLLL